MTTVHVSDWRSAIRISGELLVATGVSTDDYVDQMLKAVDEYGPYIVITPGLALAHARPSPAVLRTGLSWAGLAVPVAFGHAQNDPVHLVIGLAAVDHDAHSSALSRLARMLADRDRQGKPRHTRAGARPHQRVRGVGEQMKILAVCGMGIGTSVILTTNISKAAHDLGLDAEIEVADIWTADGAAADADVVMTSGELAAELGDVGVPVAVIDDFLDADEVRARLAAAIGH
ncbi:PTS sugar transporter subunit IIA [Nocardiopsis gilva]